MERKLLFLLLILVAVSLFSNTVLADTFTYDQTTETTCDDAGRCTLTLYSGFSPSYMNEVILTSDDLLQFLDLEYVEIDDNFGLEILSADPDGISFRLNVSEDYRHSTIPLEWMFRGDDTVYSMNYRLNSLTRVYNLGINIMDLDYVKWGYNSTVITLQDADSENLEDVSVRESSPYDTYNYGADTYFAIRDQTTTDARIYIKFNITQIPENQEIESAFLYLYLSNSVSYPNVSAYHVYNQVWVEGTQAGSAGSPNWNDQMCGVDFNSPDCNTTAMDFEVMSGIGVWEDWDVTAGLLYEYLEGNSNYSIALKTTETGGSAYSYARTKEYATAGARPYLRVTYKEADVLFPTWSDNTTNNTEAGLATLFSVNWTDMFNATTEGNLSGYIFSWYNGTNWTDASCGDFNSSQDQCEAYGCEWIVPDTSVYNSSTAELDRYCYYQYCEYAYFDLSDLDGNTSAEILDAKIYWYINQVGDTNTSVAWLVPNSSSWTESTTCDILNAYGVNTTSKSINTMLGSLSDWDYSNITEVIKSALDMGLTGVTIRLHGEDDETCGTGEGTASAFRISDSSCGSTTCMKQGEDRTGGNAEYMSITFGDAPYCAGSSNYEWKNDTWVAMSGSTNWSNVTKIINDTVGSTIKWKVYANDTSFFENWNVTDEFQFTTTGGAGPTQYNITADLDLNWADQTSRKLEATRSATVGIDFTDDVSRSATYNRLSDLAITFDDSTEINVSEAPTQYNITATLDLTWDDSTARRLDAIRSLALDMDFSDQASRIAEITRYQDLELSWSDTVTVTKTSEGCDYEIDDCDYLNQSGTYCLTDDINSTLESNCLHIDSDDVILDCQGHTVGTETDVYYQGILLYDIGESYHDNITVKNCVVTGWYFSIGNYYFTNVEIFNNTVDDNHIGIALLQYLDPINNSVHDNIIQNSEFAGFYSEFITNCYIYNNFFNNSDNVWMECGEGESACTGQINYWNITQQEGSRIYSDGTDIGGNYFTSTSGGSPENITRNYEFITDDGTFLPYRDVYLSERGCNYTCWKEGGCWAEAYNNDSYTGQHEGYMEQNTLIKWPNNITDFDQVLLCVRPMYSTFWANESYAVYLYELDNQTWSEGMDNNEGCDVVFDYGDYIDETGFYNGTDIVNETLCFNVTDYVASEVALGHENISFVMNMTFWPNYDKELIYATREFGPYSVGEYGEEVTAELIYTVSQAEGYSETCDDLNCDGFCDDPLMLEDDNYDYLVLSDEYDAEGCEAVQYNRTISLDLDFDDQKNRQLEAVRLSSLNITIDDNSYMDVMKVYTKLISLGLNWIDSTDRTLDATRTGSATITFTDQDLRILEAVRSGTLEITWSDQVSTELQELIAILVDLTLDWSDQTYRGLDAGRSMDLTINFDDQAFRSMMAQRLATLDIDWDDATYQELQQMIAKLISLSLNWDDQTGRILDADRGSILSILFTDNGLRIAEFLRSGNATINWSDLDYRTLDAVRTSSLLITWLDDIGLSGFGWHITRLISLILNMDIDQDTYIKSWENVDPYRVCTIFKQIGTSRAYLCVYEDGSYKILIRGL